MFHSSEKQNVFDDNSFHGCASNVRVDGRGDATHVRWAGNYFDDYAGFDLDGDGIGDVPHEPRSLSNQLTSAHEQFRFFRGTPALGLIDAVSRVLPILTPKVLFRDPAPRLRRPAFVKVPDEG
jgi:nitrous oxidase accessory protein